MTTGLRQYTNHSAQTATPGQLVVMLYDGFLRFAAQGQAALASGEIEEAGKKLTRAQDIVTELRATLDMTQGVIADNLASLNVLMDMRETRLKAQFTAMNTAVAQFQAQGNDLASQLAKLG